MIFRDLLKPQLEPDYFFSLVCVHGLLIFSISSLLLAPLLMPANYSWVTHTTSESAAQGITGAWLARLGFVLYGLAVVWLSCSLRRKWGKGAILFHTLFGVLMLSTAAFSIRPWESGIAFDQTEDFLHSFTSTAMGFAFSFGIIMVFMQRDKGDYTGRFLDLFAISVATLVPLGMLRWPAFSGLIQRFMFFVSYVWYAKEAFRLLALVNVDGRNNVRKSKLKTE